MFVLEESQLLEDTIKDSSVLKLYKILHENEASNDRSPILQILQDPHVAKVCELIVTTYKQHGDKKPTPEEKEVILRQIDLDKNDVAPLLMISAASLTQLFVIENFTGPNSTGWLDCLPSIYGDLHNNFDHKSLTVDSYEVPQMVLNPWLLKLTQICWQSLTNLGFSRRLLELEFLVWKHRYLTIYTSLLCETPEVLITELRKLQEFIFDHYVINEARENKTQLTRFSMVELCCELAQAALLRDGVTTSRKILDYASEVSGIEIEHTGVLGRRTRFQRSDIPQLVVKASESPTERNLPDFKFKESKTLPRDIELDDDTLLPDIKFKSDDQTDAESDGIRHLGVEAQLIMLAKMDYILQTDITEQSLKDEWTLAYLRSIVTSATIWPIKYKALALRSAVEKKNMRKMDRALLQLEELIKLVSKDTSQEDSFRMQSVYAVLPLSKWHMQRKLGDISFDLCLYKNALDVYTRIEYWEGMIKCHSALCETVKAEKIIRQELLKQETPYLYCLLGDATDELGYYEKSWVLSQKRFARAQKSIGTHYYVRKQYEEAVKHYELALSASPSNISILSLLAYSCLTLERYERAAECYRTITYNDDTNYLAWNNLSKAYIKLNQKERAWRTLREAIKCNYEEWKIWENFMIVSVDIGAWHDVIVAWHRLIDLKTFYKDDKVLSALTYSLIRHAGETAELKTLYEDALKLFSRITTSGSCSSRAWICYFRLLLSEYNLLIKPGQETPVELDIDLRVGKIAHALQRATPISTITDPYWYQHNEKIDQILDEYDELLDCYSLTFKSLGYRRQIAIQWKNFKLSINNAIRTLRLKGFDK